MELCDCAFRSARRWTRHGFFLSSVDQIPVADDSSLSRRLGNGRAAETAKRHRPVETSLWFYLNAVTSSVVRVCATRRRRPENQLS